VSRPAIKSFATARRSLAVPVPSLLNGGGGCFGPWYYTCCFRRKLLAVNIYTYWQYHRQVG